MELHLNFNFNFYGMGCQVAAALAGKSIDVKIIDQETIASKEYKAINMTGKFPMLKTPEGNISESIAIAKYLAHGTDLLGKSVQEKAQVDQWLYWGLTTLLPAEFPALMACYGWAPQTKEAYNKSVADTKVNIKNLNTCLEGKQWLVGDSITVADIMVAAYLVFASSTFLDGGFRKAMKNFGAWFDRCIKMPEWIQVAGHIKPCAKAVAPQLSEAPVKEEKKKQQPAQKKPKDDDEEVEKKPEKNPLDLLPETKFDLFNFKTFFVNHPDKKGEAVDEWMRQFDKEGWAFWYLQYEKFGTEGQVLFKTVNLCNGFLQRFESFRKYSFARHAVIGDEPSLDIEGVWLFRGTTIPQEAIDHPQFEYYKQTKLDVDKPEDVAIIREFFGAQPEGQINGRFVQHIAWQK